MIDEVLESNPEFRHMCTVCHCPISDGCDCEDRSGIETGSISGLNALTGKYGDVLRPFIQRMETELHANAGKGDRPGWLSMTKDQGMLEIYYHTAKLQKAVKDGDIELVREHAADVANMAMMMLDVCGGLVD
ncbi:MAG: hypothetical protein KZQ93_16000 [Candidatus Thiodiazotropha sp. (ex Monitilora ramsayi)]|nr:hypothetical protein [Candidatus Thiodiazotropha sp. (ex Monitilora ramsayi)]